MEAPKSVLLDYKYKAARNCFLAFCDIMKRGDLKVAPFHEIIGSAFEDIVNKRYKRLIISCPPRSGKSMLASMFLAWLLGRDQRTQHVIAAYGSRLSAKFHKDTVSILKSKDFIRVFPEWKGFSPDSKYDMIGGGYILATSVGGVLTGFSAGTEDMDSPGVGAMIIDDPLKNSNSKQALDNLQTWWQEEASTRRTNHYCQVLIATRFHEKDLHGVLMEADGLMEIENNSNSWVVDSGDFGWRWINIAGLCEDVENDPLGRTKGESHWPDNPIFSVPMLESQRNTMGSFKFASIYQGVPVAAEGQIVKSSWINVIEEEDCPDLDLVWFGVDCAFSESEKSDYSVICVLGINKKEPNTVYIKEIVKGKWDFPDLLAAVKHQRAFHKARVLCIEKAASGHSLIQMMKRETHIPIEEMKPIRSKTTRLQAVCPLLESGRVKIVGGHWTNEFVKELTSFPYVRHDDCVDAFVWGLTYYLLKIVSIDTGIQQSWGRDYRRPSTSYTSVEGRYKPQSRNRRFSIEESYVNDPDFQPQLGSSRKHRRMPGYDSI